MSDTATVETTTKVRSRRGRRILGLILAVLILLLGLASFLLYRLVAGPAGDVNADGGGGEGLTWVRSIYGMSDALEDQLDRSQAAVPGPDGSIWVVDSVHRSLMRFTPDGRFVEAVRGPEELPLNSPSRFAIDSDGTFYVCETTDDVVRVIGPDGQERDSFLIPEPVSVAVDEDTIVVGSVAGFAILNKQGEPQHVIGTRGKGDEQFDYVHGVAIAENGTIFVADSFNNRLSAWTKDGDQLWIRRTGAPGNNAAMVDDKLVAQETSDSVVPEDQRLQLPLNLTIDGAGRVVVIDMFESAIAVFDPEDGSFIGKYGEIGPDDGEFFYPQSISYDVQRDWFTVADSLNNRVQVVRIPDSAGGNAANAAVQRVLSGPLRACLFPLALILLALIVWGITRAVRNRSAAPDAEKATPPVASESVDTL